MFRVGPKILQASVFFALSALTPAQDAPRILSYQGKVTSGGVNFDGTGQFKFALLAPSGTGATATANVTSGFVTSVTLTSGGSGFIAAPTVKFSGGGGSGAVATATISGGVVTAISITLPGSGYTYPPTVSFEASDGDYGVVWRNDGSTSDGEPTSAVGLMVNGGLFSARLGDPAFPNMSTIGSSAMQKAPLRLRIWFNDGAKGSQRLGQDVGITGASLAYSLASIYKSSMMPIETFDSPLTDYSNSNPTSKSFYIPTNITNISDVEFSYSLSVSSFANGETSAGVKFDLNLTEVDPVNGNQIVLFTHHDEIWAPTKSSFTKTIRSGPVTVTPASKFYRVDIKITNAGARSWGSTNSGTFKYLKISGYW